MTLERVLREAARIAFADVRRLYDEKGNLKPLHELSDDEAARSRASSRRSLLTGGHTKKIRLGDKNTVLVSLFKHLDAFERDNAQRAATIVIKDYASASGAYTPERPDDIATRTSGSFTDCARPITTAALHPNVLH